MHNTITSYNNIVGAFTKACKGKKHKKDVIKFCTETKKNLETIRHRLCKNPNFGNYRQFFIHDPKKRLITATTFEERIMQHAIMNVLEPVFEKHFIFHTYACRKNKGSHKALRTLAKKSSGSKFFVKMDVRKFFDNIDHDILLTILKKLVNDKKTYFLLENITGSYSLEKNKGLPIGNLTSQFFANLYLSALDHYVIEKLKPQFYCRYMDDMIALCKTKDDGKRIFEKISTYCTEKLQLELKPLVIGRIKDGIPFLGYNVYRNRIVPLKKKKNARKRKLKLIDYEYRTGKISEEKACERCCAVLNANTMKI